jgi:hypothetical protein
VKLWLLKPRDGLPTTDNPWEPWYDKPFGHVIRAETESDARRLASEDAGEWAKEMQRAWLDPSLSTCVELLPDGPPKVVLTDFRSA